MGSERPIILDTGPLVAFLMEREPNHGWVDEQFQSRQSPFISCEPVLAEAFHLLSRTHNGQERLFELLSYDVVVIDFALSTHIRPLQKLMQKYRDLPMSLADACLVRMAEMLPDARVLTLDHHFKIYRKHGRQVIGVVTPPT